MKATPQENIADHFWDHVDKRGPDECWQWMKGKSKGGYGVLWIKEEGKVMAAHRYVMSMGAKKIPEGLYVCHHCDNRSCVNPAHLFLGTPLMNTHDAMKKKRHKPPPRQQPKWTKLTPEIVREIRLHLPWLPLVTIAKKFKIGRSTVANIKYKNSWAHVQ